VKKIIADNRLVAFDGERVTRWKDYRAKGDARYKLMTLDADQFIRRFLIHVLADGFHRIRPYGLFASANRAGNIALARQLLGVPDPAPLSDEGDGAEDALEHDEGIACPCCGGRMIIIETFAPGCQPAAYPIDRARQFMTITPLSPSPITVAPVRRRDLTGTGHALRTATVSTAFARQSCSIEYQITRPIAPKAAKTSTSLVTQPPSCPETDKSDQPAAANLL
jgi:hypothetical protein